LLSKRQELSDLDTIIGSTPRSASRPTQLGHGGFLVWNAILLISKGVFQVSRGALPVLGRAFQVSKGASLVRRATFLVNERALRSIVSTNRTPGPLDTPQINSIDNSISGQLTVNGAAVLNGRMYQLQFRWTTARRGRARTSITRVRAA
jgi:hypothetical protein